VGPEIDNFRLSVSGFSGDAGDALANPVYSHRSCNGMPFSTPDRDNDDYYAQCFGGITGWWFNSCARGLLNYDDNAVWNADTDERIPDVQFARMLVKLD